MLANDALLQNRYRIVKLLNQGGMGAVYQAIDQRLDITVALKECFFQEEHLRKQFEREARLLAKLRHPAMTTVIDHFTEGDGQFLVMEFIPGNDLLQMARARGGPFLPDEVLKWGDQLLDALHYLHSQTPPIIHRDIKPQNLKLTRSGQIILLDFGLAKSQATQMSQVTSSGSVFGYTQHYAPIEQIQGAGTDPRSDLYSLAATLYHLVTGVIPPDSLSRATAFLNNQPDPMRPAYEINPLVTPEITELLTRAMALNRDYRPASAAQMRQAWHIAGQSLANRNLSASASTVINNPATRNAHPQRPQAVPSSPQFVQQPPSVAAAPYPPTNGAMANESLQTPVAPRKSNRWLWIAGSLVVIAALTAIILLVIKPGNRPSSPTSSSAPSSGGQLTPAPQTIPLDSTTPSANFLRQTLTGHKKEINATVFCPVGNILASGSSDGIVKLWDAQTGELKQTFEASGSSVVSIAFSPDGRFFAVATVGSYGDGAIIIRDVQTLETKQKLTEGNIQIIVFSPDSNTLAVGNISGQLKLWDVASGKVKQTLEGQAIQTHAIAFSPDGKFLAGGGWGSTVKLWELQTGTLKHELAGHDNDILTVAFSPDGKMLASGSLDATVKLWNVETGALKQTLPGQNNFIDSVSFSTDGKILAGASNRAILLWDVQTGAVKQELTGHTDGINSVSFSPDGKLLASGSQDATVKLWNVDSLK